MASNAVLYWSVGVVEGREKDSMARGDLFDLRDALRSDEPSALGERLELALQGEGHAFEQASVDDIGEWMPIQDAVKVRCEA